MKKSSAISKFPISRGRRLRHSSWIRSLTSETELCVNDLVQPLFVREDKASSSNIIGMPGLKRLSYEELKKEVSSIVKLGIKAIAIFPVIHESSKSNSAEEALNQDNLVCRCLKFLRKEYPNLGVICDRKSLTSFFPIKLSTNKKPVIIFHFFSTKKSEIA